MQFDLSGSFRSRSASQVSIRVGTIEEASAILNERKIVAARYITSRTLIVVLQSIRKEALDEYTGSQLEAATFERFRRPDP